MSKQILKRVAATGVVATLLMPIAIYAAPLTTDELGLGNIGNNLGLSTNTDVKTVVANIIRVLLGFLAIIAVIIVLYAGFQWMTAAGNEEKITSARSTLTAGLIGLVIILAAYAITSFIITTLLAETL